MPVSSPNLSLALRTVRGERRRIRSFLRKVAELGVAPESLPNRPLRALDEAHRFLGRYVAALTHGNPTEKDLKGVLEDLGGIDRVVKRAMAEILKALGWRPDKPETRGDRGAGRTKPKKPAGRRPGRFADNVVPFPAAGVRRPRS